MNTKLILDTQNLALLSIGLVAVVAAVLLQFRRKPNPDAVEARRRTFLVQYGRLVDGSVMDVYEKSSEADANGHRQLYIVYQYEIAGVTYECSQDVGLLPVACEPTLIQPGLPCTVRYLPNNPYNSIIISETWNGLHKHGIVKGRKSPSPPPSPSIPQ